MESSFKKTEVKLEILFDVNVWAMSQKLPVSKFEQTEETPQFNGDFIKNWSEESDEENFLEVDVQSPGKLQELHNDLQFVSKRKKIKKSEKLVTIW